MFLDPAQQKQKQSSKNTHRQDGKQCTWPKVWSYKEAEIHFKSWEVDPKAHGILSCVSDLSRIFAYLRACTSTLTTAGKGKRKSMTSKVVKNPTGEFIEEATSKLAMGHNMFGKLIST